MTVSVITPTANRPVAFALAELFMARQSRQPDEWIVADGGQAPVTCTLGQTHLHQPHAPGPSNFTENLRRALAAVTGDIVVVIEDDDWYARTHLATVVDRLIGAGALISGDDDQRYYNLLHRCWRRLENKGGCLCQTAFRSDLIPQLLETIDLCERTHSYGVDTKFWQRVPIDRWVLARDHTVVGIKGVPGQVGLGIGHRPDQAWTRDPNLVTLRQWIGEDVSLYEDYSVRPGVAC